jgi:hypothetical protein
LNRGKWTAKMSNEMINVLNNESIVLTLRIIVILYYIIYILYSLNNETINIVVDLPYSDCTCDRIHCTSYV